VLTIETRSSSCTCRRRRKLRIARLVRKPRLRPRRSAAPDARTPTLSYCELRTHETMKTGAAARELRNSGLRDRSHQTAQPPQSTRNRECIPGPTSSRSARNAFCKVLRGVVPSSLVRSADGKRPRRRAPRFSSARRRSPDIRENRLSRFQSDARQVKRKGCKRWTWRRASCSGHRRFRRPRYRRRTTKRASQALRPERHGAPLNHVRWTGCPAMTRT